MLLYHGAKEHLAVELFHGRLRVSLDCGNRPASTMFSYELLADGEPHSVSLLLTGRNLTLQVRLVNNNWIGSLPIKSSL